MNINNLPSALSNPYLFLADDTKVYSSTKNHKEIRRLQYDIDNLEKCTHIEHAN